MGVIGRYGVRRRHTGDTACRLSGDARFEAILAAVGLVADHHDVAAVGQHRERILVLARGELLDGGEDDAARGTVGQQLAQLWPRLGLHRRLAQALAGTGEHPEQLVVQVVAVGDHHDGRIAHARVRHQCAGQAGHLDALAGALGVPDHATLA